MSSSPKEEEATPRKRFWLELQHDKETGEARHFFGLRPANLNTNQNPVNLQIMASKMRRNILQLHRLAKTPETTNVELHRQMAYFCLNSPNFVDAFWECAKVAEQIDDKPAQEGFLRCMLEMNWQGHARMSRNVEPLDSLCERAERVRNKILPSVDENDDKLLDKITQLFNDCKSAGPSLEYMTFEKQYKAAMAKKDDEDGLSKEEKASKEYLIHFIHSTLVIGGSTLSLEDVRTVIQLRASGVVVAESDKLLRVWAKKKPRFWKCLECLTLTNT